MNITLVKLGGSLLDLSDVADRIVAMLHSEQIEQAVVLVGGGPAADLVRRYDQQFGLSDEASHRLAIQAMALNAKLLVELHSEFHLITDSTAMHAFNGGFGVLDPERILIDLEHTTPEDNLAASWNTTSDSIAAWICQRLAIPQLILLKSTELPFDSGVGSAGSLEALVQCQLVDNNFSQAARNIPIIKWCNLRSNASVFHLTSLPFR